MVGRDHIPLAALQDWQTELKNSHQNTENNHYYYYCCTQTSLVTSATEEGRAHIPLAAPQDWQTELKHSHQNIDLSVRVSVVSQDQFDFADNVKSFVL